MNLDEKIEKSITQRMEEWAQLFNEADDVQEETRTLLSLFSGVLPLLQDMKSEIKAIENHVKNPLKPEESEEQDEEDKEPDTSPVNDPQVEQLVDDLKKTNKLRKRLRDAIKRQPGNQPRLSFDPSGDNLPDLPGLIRYMPFFTYLEVAQKSWRFAEDAKEKMDRDQKNFNDLKAGNINTKEYLKRVFESEAQNVKDFIDNLSTDEIEELNRYLEEKTDQILQRMFQLGENMSTCCGNLGDKVDTVGATVGNVKTAVDKLQPAKTAGNELATLTKVNTVLSEIHSLRGLL